MSQEIADLYEQKVKNSWNSLSVGQQNQTTVEAHTESWLEENVKTLNKNVLTSVATLIVGAIIGGDISGIGD
jgi:hypothetical protein